jgi:outer membrane receptor protein involved in Fe transport
LFGSSSQTGTIRYITKKPQMGSFAAQLEARYGTTKGGDDSYEISGVVNIPVSDTFAIRAVGFSSLDGGYVDNVLGTSFSGNYDNSDLVEEDFNEYEVDGGRVHALWNVSDNWSALVTLMGENTTAEGVWDTDEFLGDYKVTRFENEIRTDDWFSASLTLDGDLGFADLSFTYAYFDRDIAYEYDNMTYQQSKDYYYAYSLYDTNYYRSVIFNDQTQQRDTFEARLVSKGDTRLQWMVGGYYEDILDEWFYGNRTPGLVNTTAWYYAQYYAYYYGVASNYYNNYTPNTNIQYPLPETDVFWANTLDRTVTQTAFFGELSYDLTNDLTVHGGIRWAEYDRNAFQSNAVPLGLPVPPSAGDGSYVDVGKDSDTIYKIGIRYNVDDDIMFYGLFSQGFRVGGFNSARAANTGRLPRTFGSDLINNYEIGIKSQWADGRFTFNGDVFFMEWEDYQDSTGAGGPWWLRGNVNVGDAEITGVEAQFNWKATDRLTLAANLFAADSEFKDNYCGEFLNGVQQPCPVDGSGNIIQDELEIRAGMPLPNAPDFKAHASIYYTIPDVLNGDLWLYYDYTYSSEVWNETYDIVDNNRDGLAPSWSYSTFSAGLQLPSQWDIELNVRNLFDQDGYTYVGTWEADEAAVFGDPRYRKIRAQERPRTIWLTVRKGFGDI